MRSAILAGFVMVLLAACQTVGPPGAPGADGEDGADGNANVLQYEFGETTFTGLLNLTLEVERETIDNSVLLVYYSPSNELETAWYAAPGLGSTGAYQTRTFWYQIDPDPSTYLLGIRVLNLDGSGYGSELTFRGIRVLIVEASSVLPGSLETMAYDDAVSALGLDRTAP